MGKDSNTYDRLYADLIKRHEKVIFSVCFFYASSSVPFDDLKQEVFISLYKGFKSFRKECRESTWVYRVCINTCLYSLKRFSPKIKQSSIDSIAHIAERTDSEHTERIEWLYNRISRLNPLEKALILMWLDELTYDEIASNMGLPRNTVASKLHRIKDKLSNLK